LAGVSGARSGDKKEDRVRMIWFQFMGSFAECILTGQWNSD
jgi:hypothetical protein